MLSMPTRLLKEPLVRRRLEANMPVNPHHRRLRLLAIPLLLRRPHRIRLLHLRPRDLLRGRLEATVLLVKQLQITHRKL